MDWQPHFERAYCSVGERTLCTTVWHKAEAVEVRPCTLGGGGFLCHHKSCPFPFHSVCSERGLRATRKLLPAPKCPCTSQGFGKRKDQLAQAAMKILPIRYTSQIRAFLYLSKSEGPLSHNMAGRSKAQPQSSCRE